MEIVVVGTSLVIVVPLGESGVQGGKPKTEGFVHLWIHTTQCQVHTGHVLSLVRYIGLQGHFPQ